MTGRRDAEKAWLTLYLVLLLPGFGYAREPVPQYLTSDGRAGVRVYVPGAWGMLAVGVANPTDRPVELLSSVYFPGQADVHYARRLWVPARARLASWQPVLVPANNPGQTTTAELRSILLIDSTREVLRTPAGEMTQRGLVSLRHDRPTMGILADADDDDQRDAAAAMCIAGAMNYVLADLNDQRLPVGMEFLDGISQLVIASDRIAADAAAWTAVRRWLHGGGRVWVMLDQVEPSTVPLLLGDAFQCHVVDRVGLTQIEVQTAVASPSGSQGEPRRPVDLPVDLVRVAANGFRVSHTVNGWPAALWLPVGRGRVLLTALGARGWIRARLPTDPWPADTGAVRIPVATEALRDLALKFCERPASQSASRAANEAVMEQIGYAVVSRHVIVMVLGGFCVSLGVCGFWLARIGRLERLGWIAPALAVLAACVLGVIGREARTAVPASVAVAQVAEADPDVDEVRISGSMALYEPDATSPRLGAERGGVFSMDTDGLEGSTRRMVWTDFDQWHWENLSLPSGVRASTFRYATSISRPIRAQATFGPDGLTGTIDWGPFQTVEDVLLATGWSWNLAVHMGEDGRFAARADDVLPPGQLVQGAMLSQRQQWTQQMFRDVLEDLAARRRDGALPILLARAAPLDMHLGPLEDVDRLGETLVTIPLVLKRPPEKTRVKIPSLFLPCRSVDSPDGAGVSQAFSNVDGKWLGPLSAPTQTMLRFQCPESLLPMVCRSAKLTVSVQAPLRAVSVIGIEQGKVVELAHWESPIGTKQVLIDRREVLNLDRRGGLSLGIRVGDVPPETGSEITSRAWKIDEVQLELTAETGLE